MSVSLTVSVVVYRPDESWLRQTLAALRAAVDHAIAARALDRVWMVLIDNQSSGDSPHASLLGEYFGGAAATITAETLTGHGNLGYGAGNNLAFAHRPADFHLIVNPDVTLAPDALANSLAYLSAHTGCAMVTPVATSPAGAPLYLVKAYPAVATLLLRGFAPAWLRSVFTGALQRYDRSDLAYDAPITDARVVSGCFMLVRGEALRRAGGFDPGYFLYFEDFDLSWRISQFAGIARVPQCRIVHGGGGAAKKGFDHIGMFMRSALRFFRRNGWRFRS